MMEPFPPCPFGCAIRNKFAHTYIKHFVENHSGQLDIILCLRKVDGSKLFSLQPITNTTVNEG